MVAFSSRVTSKEQSEGSLEARRARQRGLHRDRILPLSALVGQDNLKRALLMLAVNPLLAGLLIRGEKGTAKSTAARGLANILPAVPFNRGCPFGCDGTKPDAWCDPCRSGATPESETRRPPFVTLPLGVTEDQLLGSFDLKHALEHGERRFEPGVLAEVNRGVLYVDEVNLLDDHIVDLLLDTAASGVNVVAREGVSFVHQSEFILLGTMNPEEGELRPQLQDRFGLCVEIATLREQGTRRLIIERCLEFETDPAGFRGRWEEAEEKLSGSVAAARERLPQVKWSDEWVDAAAELSIALQVDGHRADILMLKAGATLAALGGRTRIDGQDFIAAAPLVYAHRVKRKPLEPASIGTAEIGKIAAEISKKRKGSRKKKGEVTAPKN